MTREEIQSSQTVDDLQAIQMEIQTKYDDKIARIGVLFAEECGHTKVMNELQSIRYYQRMLDDIEAR